MADSDAGGFIDWVLPAGVGREAAVTRLMALDGRGDEVSWVGQQDEV
ncbi:hypothetical protein OG782_37750 (plasmid) [Streptomyces sp. NBC_00876]|nr:hypothetical protein OG782_37750 [Streptomyces sp. NBC_00876]